MIPDEYAVHALDEAPLVDGLDTLEDANAAALDAEKQEGRRVVIVSGDGEIRQPHRMGAQVPLTLGVQELADLLDVHPNTARRWCRDGTLPAVKVGREFRVSSADLERYWTEQGGGELWSRLPAPEPTPLEARLDALAEKVKALPQDRRGALAETLE